MIAPQSFQSERFIKVSLSSTRKGKIVRHGQVISPLFWSVSCQGLIGSLFKNRLRSSSKNDSELNKCVASLAFILEKVFFFLIITSFAFQK